MSEGDREAGAWPMARIPDSWSWIPCSDLFENMTSATAKLPRTAYLDRGAFPVIDQGADLVGGYTDREELLSPARSPSIVFGDHTRAVKLVRGPFVQGADGVKVLSVRGPGSVDFACWALRTVRLPDKGYSRHFKFLEATAFPLAPVPEQARIVGKIDELFSELDAGVAALERAQAKLEKYRASVLKAAVEGRLTEQWRRENPPEETGEVLLARILVERRRTWERRQLATFEAKGRKPSKGWKERYSDPVRPITTGLPRLPEGWCWASFESICDLQLGKMLSQKARVGQLGRQPYLRNQNVRWFHIDASDLKTMVFRPSELQKYSLEPGDLLICEGGEPGRCSVYQGPKNAVFYQKALHRARPHGPGISTSFLQFCLRHQVTQGIGIPRFSETTIQHLTLEKLRRVPLPVPPAVEQEAIVASLGSGFALVSQTERALGAIGTAETRLRQSILKRAFEGRLVPQDPNDEPASVLLACIRAQYASEQPSKKWGARARRVEQKA